MNREVERERLIKVLSKYSSESRCERHGNPFGDDYCKGCKYESEKSCEDSNRADYLLENGVIVPPCKLGDDVYFYKAELNEVCPAKVVGIYYRLHTPSMPLWIDISYESKTTGRQGCEMTSDVFKLLCHSTKEEAEKHL